MMAQTFHSCSWPLATPVWREVSDNEEQYISIKHMLVPNKPCRRMRIPLTSAKPRRNIWIWAKALEPKLVTRLSWFQWKEHLPFFSEVWIASSGAGMLPLAMFLTATWFEKYILQLQAWVLFILGSGVDAPLYALQMLFAGKRGLIKYLPLRYISISPPLHPCAFFSLPTRSNSEREESARRFLEANHQPPTQKLSLLGCDSFLDWTTNHTNP